MCNKQKENKEEEFKTAEEILIDGEARRDSDITKARRWINKQPLKKSGYNKNINYHYYEFDDFIGYVQQACEMYDLSTHFSLESLQPSTVPRPKTQRNEADGMPTCVGVAKLEVKSIHYHEPRITRVPIIYQLIHQDTGKGLNYAKRYAYMIAFEIGDIDLVDLTINGNSNIEDNDNTMNSNSVRQFRYKNGAKLEDDTTGAVPVNQSTLNTPKKQEPKRDFMDISRSLGEEMSDRGIENTDKNVYEYATKKWKQGELSVEDYREVRNHLRYNPTEKL